MLLPLLTLSLLSAAPATGLTLSAQVGKSSTPATVYLDAIEQEFLASRLPVRRLPLQCEGKRECLVDAAKKAGLPAIVSLTIASGRKQTTLDLEAVRVRDAVVIGQLTFVSTGRLGEEEKKQVRAFAKTIFDSLSEPEPVAKTDVPLVEPRLLPGNVDAGVNVVTLTPEPRSRVPAYVMGGGAIAGAITSGVFLGLATGARGELENQPNPANISRAQAQALANTANTDYSVALAAGIAAGALATGAIIWLLTE
ncbi:MAG: hypothetical protein ACO1OB_04240 [Archangium sp.]